MRLPQPLPPHWAGLSETVVEVDGHPIHCTVAGEGPTVLLLHGALFSGNNTWWGTQLALAGRFRTIAPDWIGWGASGKPDGDYDAARYHAQLLGLLDALGLEAPPIVGHSMGGLLSSSFALKHPERVGPLVMVAVPPAWVACGIPKFFQPFLRVGLGEFLMTGMPWVGPDLPFGFRRAIERLLHRPGDLPPGFVREVAVACCETARDSQHVAAFLSTLRSNEALFAGERASAQKQVGAWVRPFMAIAGAQDPLFPADLVEEGAKHVPQGRSLRHEACAHFPMWEVPEAFHAALGDFLHGATSRPAEV